MDEDAERRQVIRRWGPRALVAAVVVAAVAIFIPEAITGTFSGPGPMLRVGALVLALVAWGAVVRRIGGNAPWVRVAAIVPVALALWFTVWPYLREQDTVDDEFPVAVSAQETTVTSTSRAEPSTTTDTRPGGEGVAPPTSTSTTLAPQTSPSTTPAPLATHSGSFRGLTGHTGRGQATVFDLGEGQQLLRLEDFEAGPGPKLEVWLVPGSDQTRTSAGIFLGDLRGKGNLNYDIPADAEIDGTWTALVWCATFAVEVANATLEPS